jgi:membrane protein implicated in regulation of membrane protease activity
VLSTPWVLLLLSAPAAFAQQGKNGARTITAANTIVNAYTTLTANAAVGSKTITVGASALNSNGEAPLAAGDMVMIIQMQGATIDVTNTAAYGSVTGGGLKSCE